MEEKNGTQRNGPADKHALKGLDGTADPRESHGGGGGDRTGSLNLFSDHM